VNHESNQLAIIYRPRLFAEVLGQKTTIKDITNRLKKDRVPQDIFLRGLTGSGKNTISNILAATLVCLNKKPGEVEPCNQCEECKAVLDGTFDLSVRYRHASNLGVDEMRELEEDIMTEDWQSSSLRKVYIIDEWQELAANQKAQKNLLPLLERDLGGKVHIIVNAMSNEKIPLANQDRFVEYVFRPVESAEIADLLVSIMEKEGALKGEEQIPVLQAVADISEGSVRRAIKHLERVIFSEITDVKELYEVLDVAHPDSIKDLMNDILGKKISVLKEKMDETTFDALRGALLNSVCYGPSNPEAMKVLTILNRAQLYPYRDWLLLKSLVVEAVTRKASAL
jgi:DNA polymerase-3 subunit gamma/tau